MLRVAPVEINATVHVKLHELYVFLITIMVAKLTQVMSWILHLGVVEILFDWVKQG